MRERHVIHQRRVDLSCQSLRSSTAHLTAALTSFCVLCLLSLSPWMKTAIHHSLRFFFFFFHLCVLCSPLIYCWTCLQNGPGAFHSVKRGKGKRAPVSEKKHIQKQRKQQFSMHVNSRTVRTGACLRIILVTLCLGCVERSSDCSFDMIHIWLFETEQEIYARGINGWQDEGPAMCKNTSGYFELNANVSMLTCWCSAAAEGSFHSPPLVFQFAHPPFLNT